MRILLAILVCVLFAARAALAQQGAVPSEHAYGAAPAQKLDFYPPSRLGAAAPPLVIFVHGGGWRRGSKQNATGASKIVHLRDAGYAFATIDYRLIPRASVEQQAEDLAAAIDWLIDHAGDLGFDPTRVILMGHSAGAHLSALVGTDPQYLQKVGFAPDRLRGIILLDGAAYDVPAQLAGAGRVMRPIYVQAFGSDLARQRALSPIAHVAAPNAPAFLILHVDRDDGQRQSAALASALKASGAKVTLHAFEGRGLRGHVAINRRLGEADYPATVVVDRWLSATLASR